MNHPHPDLPTPSKLEKGTFIYRTSKNKNPNNLANSGISDINSPLIYFGLDFVISIWIALEINDKYDKNIPCYLHIYQLNNDIDEFYKQYNENKREIRKNMMEIIQELVKINEMNK